MRTAFDPRSLRIPPGDGRVRVRWNASFFVPFVAAGLACCARLLTHDTATNPVSRSGRKGAERPNLLCPAPTSSSTATTLFLFFCQIHSTSSTTTMPRANSISFTASTSTAPFAPPSHSTAPGAPSRQRALSKATSFADLRFAKDKLLKRFHRGASAAGRDLDFFGCAGEMDFEEGDEAGMGESSKVTLRGVSTVSLSHAASEANRV